MVWRLWLSGLCGLVIVSSFCEMLVFGYFVVVFMMMLYELRLERSSFCVCWSLFCGSELWCI